jgi:uncharacterized protein YciI
MASHYLSCHAQVVAVIRLSYAGRVEYFAVTTVHGSNWDGSKSIREQQAWAEHASFMDGLVADGLIVLGGPLDDGEHVLLIIEAADEGEVRQRLASDPWNPMDMLSVGSVKRWSIWLDGRIEGPIRQ